MNGLFELLSGGVSLVDLLRKNSMGGSGNSNPMMSSTIGSVATIPAQKQSNRSWEKWAQPQDVSAGLSAAQPNDPMYNQMMQQVMQQQPQQQRQPMTSVGVAQLPQTGIPQATMPQMPGAIHPNEDMMSLFRRLMGGA